MSTPRYAVATLVMNGDKYIPGAICLAKSVKRISPTLSLVCMVTSDVPIDDLEEVFDEVIEVPRISVKDPPRVGGTKASHIYSWNSDAPTKWNILNITHYDKILFMDADMIAIGDIRPLFDLSCPAAVFDHQMACEYVASDSWTGDRRDGRGFTNWYKVALGLEDPHTGYLPGTEKYGHLPTGKVIPSTTIITLRTRANCQFALQGGLVLLKPDASLYSSFCKEVQEIANSLCKTMHTPGSYRPMVVPTDRTLSAIDEVTLSLFFSDHGYSWTSIDIRYNISAYHLYAMMPKDEIRVIHFITTYKPWNTRPDGITERDYIRKAAASPYRNSAYKSHMETVEKWWEIYES